jgi:hypothetical protein
MSDLPPLFDPDADPLIKQLARGVNYLGDIAGQLARIADALQGSNAYKGGAEPAGTTAPVDAGALLWGQVREELRILDEFEKWPRGAPAGFDKVAADYDAATILSRCRKYREICLSSSDERRWWGRGMFKETRWPIVMDKTKPVARARREMPRLKDEGTLALLAAYGVGA